MSDRYDFYSDNNNSSYVEISLEEAKTSFIKSYLWMFTGALITFLSGLAFSKIFINVMSSESIVGASSFLIIFFVAFIAELFLGFFINKNALIKMNFAKALIGFIIYSLLNGFTFSVLFAYFDASILYQIFGVVALYYLVLTGLSFIFRKSITKLSGFAIVGLITLLVLSIIVSIYSFVVLPLMGDYASLSTLYLAISIFGLIVFTILTLVDIRSMKYIIEGSIDKKSASIAAAFTLYLDFINIFIYVLRIVAILGRNRR